LHIYTLTITKDDFWLEFKSFDKHIVEKELGVWITAAAELWEETKDQMPPEPKIVEPKFEKIELGRISLDRPKVQEPESIIEPVREEVSVQVEPVFVAPVPPLAPPKSIVAEEKQHHSYKISDETKEILQRAIHKPQPTMEEVLREDKIKKYDPVKINTIAQERQTAPRDLPHVVPPPPPVVPQEDFTTIFNHKIVQENSSTDKFAQLLSLQNIHNKFDCLIACAYHLVERENFERFTLKQINTLSKALLEEAIEHDTLKEALERRLIKIVPDYTGIATTMEYTLTDNGIRYFEQEIAE